MTWYFSEHSCRWDLYDLYGMYDMCYLYDSYFLYYL